MKKILKFIILLCAIVVLSCNYSYASMADYSDEEAEKIVKQEQQEWEKEKESRIDKSSNNYLKSLSVEKYDIKPKFDKQIVNYEIQQEISEDYIEIKVEADDQRSSVSGAGKITLNSGENNLRIDITAENGTVRTYFIKVNKTIKQNIRLKSLEIITDEENVDYTPEFKEEIFEYSCTVENYTNSIEIKTTANDKNAKVTTTGNENLKEGLNEIIVKVSTDERRDNL